MGYTTRFTGQIDLSRKLTLAEAKTLLDLAAEDREVAAKTTGTDAYLQWVPTEGMDGIVWDGQEKFYEYVPLMKWLCGWLLAQKIAANGTIYWSGEDARDTGRINVTGNMVDAITGKQSPTKAGRPLTLEKLGEIALAAATGAAA